MRGVREARAVRIPRPEDAALLLLITTDVEGEPSGYKRTLAPMAPDRAAKLRGLEVVPGMGRVTMFEDEYALLVELVTAGVEARAKIAQRGVDFPCEECGKLEGNFVREGWYRCAACGYPSK